MIASTPRSGSTHLASCLWRAGDLGAPLEYLNPIHIRQMSPRLGARGYLSYWRGVQARRTSPNGVFGHPNRPDAAVLIDEPELHREAAPKMSAAFFRMSRSIRR